MLLLLGIVEPEVLEAPELSEVEEPPDVRGTELLPPMLPPFDADRVSNVL